MTYLHRKTMAIAASALLTLALLAPAALAQSSSQDGYIQEGPSILDETGNDNGDVAPGAENGAGNDDEAALVGDSGATPVDDTQEASASQLPFTGADLGLVGLAGASLMLLGFGMRRLTRTPDAV